MLYDKEIVTEEAILAWADEKESAEAHERVFLKRYGFVQDQELGQVWSGTGDTSSTLCSSLHQLPNYWTLVMCQNNAHTPWSRLWAACRWLDTR